MEHAEDYTPGVHGLQDGLGREVVEIWFDAEGVEIDDLTGTQVEYTKF